MRQFSSRHAQRGVTLFVGLIMLVLITLVVTTAFTLSNTNLKSVGNMQVRNEAIAAANQAIDQILSSSFHTVTSAQDVEVDINNDTITDYVVRIATPVCIRASVDTAAVISSVTLGSSMSSVSSWNTLWHIEATVDDPITGAKTTVRVGTRVLLSEADKTATCS